MAVEMVKAADIPDAAFLAAVEDVHARERRWANLSEVTEALDFPWKVVLAKAKRLIGRGLLEGCTCGCRGDFEIPGWRDRYPERPWREVEADLLESLARLQQALGVTAP